MANSTGKKQQGSGSAKAEKAPSAGVRSPLAIPFTIKRILVNRIRRFKRQPRTFFEKHAMRSLKESLETLGQGDPISVRILKGDPDHDYELIDGERRWRAARKAGQQTIVAMVYEIEDEATQFKLALLKNSGKAPHQPLEIFDAILRLTAENCSNEEIAHLLSIHVISVSMYRRLTKLSDAVRDLMSPERHHKERLRYTAALELVDLSHKNQLELAKKSAAGQFSLKQLKHAVRKLASGQTRMVGNSDNSDDSSQGSYRDPNKDYTMFKNFVENMADEAGIWEESTTQDYERIFASRDDSDRRKLVAKLKEAVVSISRIQAGLGKVDFRHVGPRVRHSNQLPRIVFAS